MNPDIKCLICIEDVETNKEFLPCSHFFHSECIGEWLKDHPECPICKVPSFIESKEQLDFYNTHKSRREEQAAADSIFFQQVSRGLFDNSGSAYMGIPRQGLQPLSLPPRLPGAHHGLHGPNCTCGADNAELFRLMSSVISARRVLDTFEGKFDDLPDLMPNADPLGERYSDSDDLPDLEPNEPVGVSGLPNDNNDNNDESDSETEPDSEYDILDCVD
jgi:hypothetical protein